MYSGRNKCKYPISAEKYTYEFKRKTIDVDEYISILDIIPGIDSQHENYITKAEKYDF